MNPSVFIDVVVLRTSHTFNTLEVFLEVPGYRIYGMASALNKFCDIIKSIQLVKKSPKCMRITGRRTDRAITLIPIKSLRNGAEIAALERGRFDKQLISSELMLYLTPGGCEMIIEAIQQIVADTTRAGSIEFCWTWDPRIRPGSPRLTIEGLSSEELIRKQNYGVNDSRKRDKRSSVEAVIPELETLKEYKRIAKIYFLT